MNHGHFLTVVKANLALDILNFDTVVNSEDVDLATFSEEDFCFGWVCRVGLIVHCQALDLVVVSTGNDKKRWGLVVLDPVWHRKTQSNKRILRSARTLG